MPHEQMDQRQVAAYLHMDLREVLKLASRGKIPCRRAPGGFVFRKGQIDHWVWEQMHTLGKDRLAGIEKGVGDHHGMETGALIVRPLIPDGCLAAPLRARTREAAIRALIDLAAKADLVFARDKLIEEIRKREELCSTAMLPGVALPHPRHPLPYDIAASFVVVGLTPGGIPYGAAGASLTRLFFLICCKDDRTHLHVLARLAQMLHNEVDLSNMISADNAAELGQIILECEKRVRLGA